MKLITLVWGMVVIAVVAAPAPAQEPKFEVASIKANNTAGGGQNIRRLCRGVDTLLDPRVESIPVGRCLFERAPLDYLIAVAYREELGTGRSLPPNEIVTRLQHLA